MASRVARRSGSWEEAENLLDDYSQRYGDDNEVVSERLMLKATRGELASVAPRLIAMIEEGRPEARLAREAVVIGLLFSFRWAEADRNLQLWLKAAPEDPLAWFLRGKYFEQRQQTLEAISSYRKVLELDPDHDEARLRLTTQLLNQRQVGDLIPHLERLRERLPHLPEVHTQWAKALALNARHEEARAAIEECLRRFPDYPPALAERGLYAIQAGDDRTADQYLTRALRAAPSDYTARSQHVAVLLRLGRSEEAEREREALRAMEADQERIGELVAGPLQSRPNDPAVPHEIAVIALRSGQAAEAQRWLKTALSIDPAHGPTHQVLANLYQASGNPALAAKHRAMASQYFKKP